MRDDGRPMALRGEQELGMRDGGRPMALRGEHELGMRDGGRPMSRHGGRSRNEGRRTARRE
ncbi:hypothetical protein DQG23_26185 [Paenibacillus contaminans]|uniref:Uncharacterized protein n=1 Tax=Paenibacillus contaminans TaxID=450362 RepID=A0A329MCY4_9BACL|nr:hypothetical protein DQG23_26185 [Paenibacillus contaminans]